MLLFAFLISFLEEARLREALQLPGLEYLGA